MTEPTNKDFEPAQEGDSFYCESGYGVFARKPFVTLTVLFDTDRRTKQMSTQEARALALNLLECAEAADMDAVIVKFLTENLGQPLEAASLILYDFRLLRDKINSESVEPTE